MGKRNIEFNWTAECRYPGKEKFVFYSRAFVTTEWSELRETAQAIVEEEWSTISPYPAPPIVALLPGVMHYVQDHQDD